MIIILKSIIMMIIIILIIIIMIIKILIEKKMNKNPRGLSSIRYYLLKILIFDYQLL